MRPSKERDPKHSAAACLEILTASQDVLAIWTIYDHPSDLPEWFVAKREFVGRVWPESSYRLVLDRSLAGIRSLLRRHGLTCLPPSIGDDPVILECWL